SLGQGAAIADNFGPHGVDIGRPELEFGGDQRTAIRSGLGRGAIHGQTGVGRQADDNRRGGGQIGGLLWRRNIFALFRHRLLLGDHDGATRRAAVAAVACATAVAAVACAAAVAAAPAEETAAVAAIAGTAPVAAIAKQ